MHLKAEDPYFLMIKFSGRKVEILAYNISKKTLFVGYFSDTNMNLLFQRKCVNALSRVFMVGSITFNKHLVNINFGQHVLSTFLTYLIHQMENWCKHIVRNASFWCLEKLVYRGVFDCILNSTRFCKFWCIISAKGRVDQVFTKCC